MEYTKQKFDDTKDTSAYVSPHLSFEHKIGGTVYTVTCSFDGKEHLRDKYQRIIFQNLSKKGDGKHDNASQICYNRDDQFRSVSRERKGGEYESG